MFTGIVEAMGRIAAVDERGRTRELRIEAPEIVEALRPGDSVSVDGACLTVTGREGSAFLVETIGTTLSRTVAATYGPGRRVNLERAMALGQRLDGHLVQGHVDGVGTLAAVAEDDGYWLQQFVLPPTVWEQTILHGSIAINGVSLTVNALEPPDRCQVGIIPFTWEHTNLKDLRPGDPVNLEGDLIGKYVGRMLAARGIAAPGAAGTKDA